MALNDQIDKIKVGTPLHSRIAEDAAVACGKERVHCCSVQSLRMWVETKVPTRFADVRTPGDRVRLCDEEKAIKTYHKSNVSWAMR